MTLREFFGKKEDKVMTEIETREKLPDLIEGSIYYINKNEEKGGYGFISSKAIPYERIFFHWSDLKVDTVKFKDLKKGMKVHFKPLYQEPNEFNDKEGWRAIQIRVLPREE